MIPFDAPRNTLDKHVLDAKSGNDYINAYANEEVESGVNTLIEEEPSVDDFHDCETSDGKWMSSEDIESMCRDMSIRSASATAEAILEQTKETILQLQCQRDEYRYEVGSLNVSLNERDELLEECDEKIKELRAQVSRLKRRKHN